MNPDTDTYSSRILLDNLSCEAIGRPSFADSRAPSRQSKRPARKRKFSLAAKRDKAHIENFNHSTHHDEGPPSAVLCLLLKIPNMLDQETGKSMRDLAIEDLEYQPPQTVRNILEEYTMIPHTIRISKMLTIAADRRASIRERVLEAKTSLAAKINSTYQDEDMGNIPQQHLDPSSPSSEQIVTMAPRDSQLVDNIFVYEPISKYMANKGYPNILSDASQTHGYFDGLEFNNYAHDIHGRVISYGMGEDFARLATEAGVSSHHAPITSAIIDAITTSDSLVSSRTSILGVHEANGTYASKSAVSFGSKLPSRENPFASFITERSDSEAAELPTELRICYDAHNQAQDRLRHMWRQARESSTAEDVARQLWGRLPGKEFEVSSEVGGVVNEMKSLNYEKLFYVWVMRFMERCKAEGW